MTQGGTWRPYTAPLGPFHEDPFDSHVRVSAAIRPAVARSMFEMALRYVSLGDFDHTVIDRVFNLPPAFVLTIASLLERGRQDRGHALALSDVERRSLLLSLTSEESLAGLVVLIGSHPAAFDYAADYIRDRRQQQ